MSTDKPNTAIQSQFSRQQRITSDRWENEKNRFGSDNDPMTITSFKRSKRLDRNTLDALYEHNSLAKRIINIPADDATREWIKITHDTSPEKAEFIEEEMKRLNIQSLVWEGIVQGRLYGGDLLVLGAFDGREMDMPLGTIKRIEFMHNVDRFLVFPQTYYTDPMDMRFGDIETYLIHRIHLHGSLTSSVHESRALRFDGEYLTQLNRLRNIGWHNPVLQHMWEELRAFGVSMQAGSGVLQDFITKKLKIDNLQELVSTEEGYAQVLTRISLVATSMAINNVAVYGADEDMDKMGTPITGLPDLMEKFKDFVSGAAGIPKSRLFQSESGSLGGDQGKNDLRVHYDNIKAFQQNKLRGILQKIIDWIGAQKGFKPGEVDFTFNPLWQMSEEEKSEIRYQTAQADEIYLRNNVVEPEEVAVSRFGGHGVDTDDMNIDVERREKFLEALSKQPIELNENEEETDPEDGKVKPADPNAATED